MSSNDQIIASPAAPEQNQIETCCKVNDIRTVQNIIRNQIGLDQDALGLDATKAAIKQRLNKLAINDLDSYLILLRENSDERHALCQLMLVSESWLMRESATLNETTTYLRYLKETIRKPKIRILSVPCARGEEPISLLHAALQAGYKCSEISITGIDLSFNAISLAKEGILTGSSMRESTVEFMSHYFDRIGSSYKLKNEYSECLSFFQQNILECSSAIDGDEYDVIYCRNLLIYLGIEEKNHLISTLSTLLTQGGLLAVAVSESPLVSENDLIHKKGTPSCIFFRTALGNSYYSAGFDITKRDSTRKTVNNYPFKNDNRSTKKIKKYGHNCHVNRGDSLPLLSQKVVFSQNKYSSSSYRTFDSQLIEKLDQAFAYADAGKHDIAQETCIYIVDQDPLIADSYFLLGLIASTRGERDLSIAYFKRTLYLQPNHEDAILQLKFATARACERGDL